MFGRRDPLLEPVTLDEFTRFMKRIDVWPSTIGPTASSLAGETFQSSRFRGREFSERTLVDCTFTNCDFTHVSFQDTTLVRVSFENCRFIHASFDGAEIFESRITDSSMAHVKMRSAVLNRTVFSGSDVVHTKWPDAKVSRTTFQRCKLMHLNASEALVWDVDIRNSDAVHMRIPGDVRTAPDVSDALTVLEAQRTRLPARDAHGRAIRVRDADRDQVVERLRVAMSDGQLTVSEGEDRQAQALTAVTREDLDRLVDDLGPTPPSPAFNPQFPEAIDGKLKQIEHVILEIAGSRVIMACVLIILATGLGRLTMG